MSTKYAVLGAGNAGFAFAGHLGLKGFEANLYEDPQFFGNMKEVVENGGIELRGHLTGFGKLNKVTCDMEEAVKDVDIIIIAVPEFAQEKMFTSYIKYARDGQIIAFYPGNYASFKFKKMIEESGLDLTIAEASSIPYGARKKAPGSVDIIGWKYKLHMACMPYSRTDEVLAKLNEFNDVFIKSDSVLAVSLNNPNFVVHCTASALNAGWIESTKGDFSLYWQGMSPSVCNVIEAVDAERCAVAEAFGYEILSEKGFFDFYYDIRGNSLYEVIQQSENHGCSGAPSTLRDRYIAEDAPAGLTAIVALGRMLGIPTPNCQAVLTICSSLNQTDYYNQGLNVSKLGIDGMTKEQIIAHIM